MLFAPQKFTRVNYDNYHLALIILLMSMTLRAEPKALEISSYHHFPFAQ